MDKTIVNSLMRTCIEKGYSVTAAAAVVGNWVAEGCLNPANINLDRMTNGYHEVGALGFTAGVAESFLRGARKTEKNGMIFQIRQNLR